MSSLAERALELAHSRAARTAPAELLARGVVPTPPELARAAIARADALLRDQLGLADGIASEHVVVIDPAVGTGVWLAALLDFTRVLPARARALIGVDLDAESLVTVERLLADACRKQRVTLALRCENTLALPRVLLESDPRVRVILGNPPWAARSLSRGSSLSDAWLAEFRLDHEGAPLGERRIGVLSDDYVRFYRWALEQARTSPSGALICFATNGSFLDGPVHRGMRAALAAAFDLIEVVDLGGNTLLSRDATSDESVFGVRVGAAVSWALRRPGPQARAAIATYRRMRGTRDEKLAALASGGATSTTHTPAPPWFRLRPLLRESGLEGDAGFSLAQAFPFHREGVQTNRDALCTAATPEALAERLAAFVRGELDVAPSRHFDPMRARSEVAQALQLGTLPISALAYRPLSRRYFVALPPLCHRPRPELLRAVSNSSLCLLSVRKERGAAPYNLFAAARDPADACFLSVRSSCRTRVFPSHGPDGEQNLDAALRDELARRTRSDVDAEAVLLYALGTLGSPRFRAHHDEALKCDYPRLPWPRDGEHFARTLAVGARFVAALDDSPDELASYPRNAALDEPIAPASLRYSESERRVLAGARVLLSDVEPASWQAAVGHHSIVRSALAASGAPTLHDLLRALGRAARWAAASQCADALFEPDVRVDSAGRSA